MLLSRAAAATTITTLALALTACGGGGDTLSKSELQSKAESICKDFAAKAKAIEQPSSTDTNAQVDYYNKLSSTIGDFADKLKDLKPADDVKSDWNSLTSNLEKTADATKTVVQQAKDKDTAGAQKTSQELNALSSQGEAAQKRLGLSDCGS